MTRLSTLLALIVLISVPACSRKTEDKPSAFREAQKKKALAAKDALFKALSSRLKATMESDGAPAAISVCATEAIAITTQVGEAHGVKIGRTAVRLRNEANGPPDWAKSLVAKQSAEPTFTTLPDGGLGALLPIRLKKLCESCHGDPESFPAELRAALAEAYPADRATGFREGDLRGWFWVEVAAR